MSIPSENRSGAHALETLLARERAWAERAGLATDASGRLRDVRDALCFEPDAGCRARLSRHPERPLGEAGKPGAVCEPGSAWSLACNLLEAVPETHLDRMLDALRSPGCALRRSFVHPVIDDGADAAAQAGPVLSIEREGRGPVYVEVRGSDLAWADIDTRASVARLAHPEAGWGDLEACRRLAIETSREGAQGLELSGTLRRLRSLTRVHGRRGFRYLVLRPRFGTRFDELQLRAFDALRMRIGGEMDFDAVDAPTLLHALATTGAHPEPTWVAERFCELG